MVNVVIYARFSSHSQTEQSIEGQLKECYEFAKRNDYNVIGEYIDRALTGTTDKRPEFLRMIEDSKKKTFKYVLVYQLDRFARNRYDSATYKAKLKKNGVRVLSAKENITEDASGILVEGVLESMAEYYSVELSQKIRRGIEVSASKCQFFGGSVPLGYYIDEDKHYQIDESKAVFVRKIFEMYADGKTIVEIEKYLLDNKVYNNGRTIGHGTVKRMLHNRRYLGYYIFHDKEVKGGIPQIISDELYETVQARLERNTKAPSSKKAREPFLLTTNVICANGQHKILKAAELNVDQSRNPISDYGFPINLFFIINFTINICFYLQ